MSLSQSELEAGLGSEVLKLSGHGADYWPHRALQSAAQELERQRATDSLKKGLEKRPEREELIERMPCPYVPFPSHV